MKRLFLPFFLIAPVFSINPIIVSGRKFFDSVTHQEFFIKGVDYQPGGSSATLKDSDPLSDVRICSRDIALFQKLKINTIRVYNIESTLNHDKCMSLLAAAGIYLVLDVNSPLPNHHLNRYEPWATYTKDYLRNVFLVVQQFSTYNNTLGFFAGNEIVNDPTSATKAPIYVKAVVRDIKNYIKNNSPRTIPVGYSAADDLNYRIPLSKYLECTNRDPAETVDFYGINSYQWCGDQTFFTSGYDVLVNDYENYTKPVFFSEYGCNIITPRKFDEVRSIYLEEMNHVVKGGLIYEFTEEPNNYGLVRVLPDQNIQLLADFHLARVQFQTLPSTQRLKCAEAEKRPNPPRCDDSYENLFTTKTLPPCVALDLVHKGVRVQPGRYVELTDELLLSPFKVFDVDGDLLYMAQPRVEVVHPLFLRSHDVSGTYIPVLKTALSEPGDKNETSDEDTLNDDTDSGSSSDDDPNVATAWSWRSSEDNSEPSFFREMLLKISGLYKKIKATLSEAFDDLD